MIKNYIKASVCGAQLITAAQANAGVLLLNWGPSANHKIEIVSLYAYHDEAANHNLTINLYDTSQLFPLAQNTAIGQNVPLWLYSANIHGPVIMTPYIYIQITVDALGAPNKIGYKAVYREWVESL